jgi:2-polyprenyl-6-hydroxyphenyl methylase/3-demethylubiquinone-9 3-methyltransferase
LRPGGVLVLSTPSGGYLLNDLPRFSDHPDPSAFESIQFKPNSDEHIFLLYEDEVRRFAASAGLEVRRLELITNPLTAGHMKLGHLLHILPERVVGAIEGLTRRLPQALSARLNTHLIVVLAKPEPPAGGTATGATAF